MVDFTRFMGRGALEPRLAPIKPAPQVKAPAPAPAPAPLPSVEPAPMPAPVAPLPTPIPSFAPDPMNIPGLPQLPMPAPVPPVAQPAPVPAPVPTPVPLPQVEPMPPVKPLPTTPPIMELPNVPPFPVTPPPMVEPVPTPVPAPTPITPPPTPPTPVAPPPMVEPAPTPVPVTPPPLPPQPVPTPVAPPPVIEPAPAPTPITPPPTPPILEGEFSLPEEILNRLRSEERFESPPIIAQPNVPPAPVPTATPAPAPSVGIETLAPEDFTAPAGIAAGPMSTPAVNNRVEAMESNIPMPDGSQFNLENLDVGGFEIDPQIIQNALADAGLAPPPVAEPEPAITPNLDAGLTLGDTFLTEPQVDLSNERELAEIMRGGSANRGDVVAPTPEPTPTASSFQPEAGGFTLTPEQQAAIDAAIGSGSFSLIDDSYGFTDGQQDAAGVIPGAGAAANATTNASTNPNAGQDWYENMTDEQREAYDAFIAGGGLANIPGGTIDLSAIGGGTVNIPGIGGYTVPTVRPTVEAIQNLTPNRDPTLAGNVSAATQYGLTGAPPVQAPSTNPFQRPETQQGIGSLAGGG